jgi:uncharacterized protein (TIGR02217 family)
MGFQNELMPTKVGYGTKGGFGWHSAVHELDSGAEQRVSRRSIFRKEFDASIGIRNLDDLSALRHHVASMKGAVHSFPVLDWQDYSTGAQDRGAPTKDDVVIGTGDGSNVVFQLSKRYGTASNYVTWNIKKPQPATTVVAVDGLLQFGGTDYNIDNSTGIITFDGAAIPADGAEITAGCEFWVPCRYSVDVDELFQIAIEEFEVGDVPVLGLVEDLDPSPISDEYDYGGAEEFTETTGTVTPSRRMVSFADDGVICKLQAVGPLPFGGPIHVIKNDDGSGALTVNDETDTLVVSIPASSSRDLWIMKSGGSKAWLAI